MRKGKKVERGGEGEVREEKKVEDGDDKGGCVRRKEDGVVEGKRAGSSRSPKGAIREKGKGTK